MTAERDDFEALVRRYQAQVCAVAYAQLRDRGRAEEVAQDAFLIAWRDRAQFARSVQSPQSAPNVAWICGIARNLARNAARRRKEMPMTMSDDPATTTPDARDALITREDLARAHAALARLPERYREAIALYYGGDESIATVATALGISEDAARQRVHRGRSRLRDLLATVETTLRGARPTAAFTAACVAAWAIAKPVPAHAGISASTGTSSLAKLVAGMRAKPFVTALVGGVLVLATGTTIVAGVVRANRDHKTADQTAGATSNDNATNDPRAGLTSRFPASAVHPRSLPPHIVAVASPSTPSIPATSAPTMVNLDFGNAPFLHLIAFLRIPLQTPIWVAYDAVPTIDVIQTHGDVPAIDALDLLLDKAAATRTEVGAIQIIAGGRTDAASFGGDLVSLDIHAMPLNALLGLLEPKLGMPIGRLDPEAVPGDNSVDTSPPITLDVHDVPAGAVLEQALVQAHVGYELTTGFVILPRS
ncbi:MAG: sigma-70 family RNA polymerase sigma factor [Kofleriaceae bacterium]